MKRHPDYAMILSNYCRLRDAVADVYSGHWQPWQVNDFAVDAGAALQQPGCTVTEQDAIDALRGDRKPIPGQRGDWWVGDLCKAKRSGTGDPLLDAYIADKGKRPADDIFKAMIWDDELAKLREERGAA